MQPSELYGRGRSQWRRGTVRFLGGEGVRRIGSLRSGRTGDVVAGIEIQIRR